MTESFPAGMAFLQALEVLCEGETGFHMGTAKNVQFYLHESFLFHLRLMEPHSDTPVLMLSPQHHGQLRDGTHDGSHLLFRRRIHKVISTLRLTGMHVMRQQRGYRISCTTPWTFFDLFAGQLLDIVRSGESGPFQVDLFDKPDERKRRRRRRRRGSATERRVRDVGERMLLMAAEVDDALGVLTAELQDRLGGEVSLHAAAGLALLEAAGAAGDESTPWRAESVAEVVRQALADGPARGAKAAAPAGGTDANAESAEGEAPLDGEAVVEAPELEELEAMVIDEAER